MKISILYISLITLLLSCSKADVPVIVHPIIPNPINTLLVDNYADSSAVNLFNRLVALKSKGIMVGHHETDAYGVGWNFDGTNETSDIKKVTGDMPAIFGWDVSGIDIGNAKVIDGVYVSEVTRHVKWVHANGGINTFCWHAYNPIDGNDSWKVNNTTVKNIIPGGKNYSDFRIRVNRIGAYLKGLKDSNGKSIPILFRPWHENSGNWFWWGTTGCTPDEYKTLWQTTVKILRDSLKVNNLIYVYSPNGVSNEAEYLSRYPGDDYVDILGFDQYYFSDNQYIDDMTRNVAIVKKLGNDKGKLFAITETGNVGIKQSNWFTQQLYPLIQNKGLIYLLFWRNADTGQYYVPYVGQNAASDFKLFTDKPDILLLPEIN